MKEKKPFKKKAKAVLLIGVTILIGTAALCLCIIKEHEHNRPKLQARRVYGADEEDVKKAREEKEQRAYDEGLKETVNITIVDEFPPESELETRIISESRGMDEEQSDTPFFAKANLIDTGHDSVLLLQEDGSIGEDEGIRIELNTVNFLVPDGGDRVFGIPNFSTTIYGDGEWEKIREMHDINAEGDDCADFNGGIDATRQLVNEGYLDVKISELLGRYPEIDPFGREYTMRLTYAGETFRESDQYGCWDVDYTLYTTAADGEEVGLLTVEIYMTTLSNGSPQDWDDAHYRLWAWPYALWRLMEDPVKDRGRIILQQIVGDVFADEETVRSFVEEQGAAFFLPEGVDTKVQWSCRRQEEFFYDYLVWQGETADYAVTLAIPLMEKADEGYFLASYIRREAEDQETCRHILSGMMQTLRGRQYLHVVKEGESLCRIAEKYMGHQNWYREIWFYDETNDAMVPVSNPDLIYPGQKVYVRYPEKYDADHAQKYMAQTKD